MQAVIRITKIYRRVLKKPVFHEEKVVDEENPGLALNFPLANSKHEFPLRRIFTRRYAASTIRGENWRLIPGFSETAVMRSNIGFFNTLLISREELDCIDCLK